MRPSISRSTLAVGRGDKTGTRQCTRAVHFRLLVIPNLSYDYDPGIHLVFRLLLALCRLVGLSMRRIIEPFLTAFIGFAFALVAVRVRSRNALHNITKYMSSTGIIMNLRRLRDIL